MSEAHPFTLALVVAAAENDVIGREGKLPWRLKSDLKRFRRLTMGHPLIMGRKTFASIGKPLDGRDSVIVTRDAASIFPQTGVFVATSIKDAVDIARARAVERGVAEAFVIGGAEIFTLALPYADRIHLARVHASPSGDAYWQAPPAEEWQVVSREEWPANQSDEFSVTDLVLERSPRA
ncbi:dihydrofolate reductase [Rhodomicrobium vannielii ATCC 17100]|uniref:dihydrofolate reductase n=1 Tax=Rhodomicrobium vannielii TaxID=1069 RepID=UPI001919603A|nr:dihydrofolate reductase [Rhodomicrobium vannielii]MBJ7534446.1 dihydrofolate reductase [Rhodomicrobium vannielii ATCC 17100]